MRTRITAGFRRSPPPEDEPSFPSLSSKSNLFLSFHNFVVRTESRSRNAFLRAISAWISSGVRWKYSSPSSVTAATHTAAGTNARAPRPVGGGFFGSGGGGGALTVLLNAAATAGASLASLRAAALSGAVSADGSRTITRGSPSPPSSSNTSLNPAHSKSCNPPSVSNTAAVDKTLTRQSI